MINQPLLSICIPTYNRPFELRQTLVILVKQIDILPAIFIKQIQFIISDNHSEYDVTALIDEFAKRLSIKITIHDRNIGPTLNFEHCFLQANGKYVLILSDDDHLVDGALADILNCLAQSEQDILFLPFSQQPERAPDAASIQSLERNRFLTHVGLLPTLISACIYRRELISVVQGRYLDTNLHHYHYFLHAVENGERFAVFCRQMLDCPYKNNAGGYDWFAVFGEQFFRIIDDFDSCRIKRRILKAIQREMLVKRIIPTFVNRRINGYTINRNFNDDSIRRIFYTVSKRCRRFVAYWLLFVPAYFLPASLLNSMKKIYLRLKLIQSD